MTPAPSLTLGRSPAASPTGTGQQSHGRPSGGIHNTDQGSPYSLNEILALLGFVGYRGQTQANMGAIVMAESGGDPNAVHVNADGSRDRGLFQINSAAHPDVSDACAFDPVCSANAAMRIQKGSSLSAWSTWTNGSAAQQLPAVEQAQRNGHWKRFQSEFANDKLGQAGKPPSASAGGGKAQSSGRLFDCSNGSTVLGIIPTSLPDVGCYMNSMFVATVYALGGLLLVGAGVLLVMRKNPVSMGLKATGMAGVGAPKTAAQQLSGERLALQQQREARLSKPRPVSRAQELSEAREQRLAAQQEALLKPRVKQAEAKAKIDRSVANLKNAEAFATRQRAKNPAGIGNTRTFKIGGQDIELPSLFEAPGLDDPSRMAG